MKLLFKQRLFSWFDNYDVYDEEDKIIFSVKGQLSWGYCLKIFDTDGNHIGTVKKRTLTLLPKIEIYSENNYIGSVQKKFSIFKPNHNIDFNDWQAIGDFYGWDYQIFDSSGITIATISKHFFNWNDTFIIDIANPNDALYTLMLVIAIDAGICN